MKVKKLFVKKLRKKFKRKKEYHLLKYLKKLLKLGKINLQWDYYHFNLRLLKKYLFSYGWVLNKLLSNYVPDFTKKHYNRH
jgi:hypothetical protein